MKTKNKTFLLSAILLTSSIITPTIVLNSHQNKTTNGQIIKPISLNKNYELNNDFDLKESQKYFFDYINWINQQSEPIAIFNWSASLPYQEALFIAMVNYFNQSKNQLTMIQEEKFRTNPRYDIDKLSKLPNSPFNILNPDLEHPDQLEKAVENDKINVLYDKRENNNLIVPPNKSQIAENHIQPILNFLKKNNKAPNETKVNIILPDLFFIQLFNNWTPSIDDPLIQLIANAKSILLTTDGAGHIVGVVENGLLKFVLSNEFEKQSESVIKTNLKNIQDFNKEAIAKLTKNDIYNILLLRKTVDNKFDFIHFVHYDSSYSNNLFTNKTDAYGNHIEPLDENNKWNVSSVSLNVLDYAKLIKNKDQTDQFVDYFDKAFFVDKSSKLFVSFDPSNFDPKKKTAIFVGSSLFSPQPSRNHNVTSLEEFGNLRSYVQESFSQFLNKYPPSEFNIIFKHHPIYSAQDSITLTQIYTDNKIEIPNIINSQIPFEYLLSSEFAKAQRNDPNRPSILFSRNNKNIIEPKFKLFGFQATTSLIHTTRLFLETSLNLSKTEIENVVSFDDFLVPTLFDVINKPVFDQKKYNKFESNKKKIETAYRFFNPSQWNNEIGEENDRFLLSTIKPLGENKGVINDMMIDVLIILFMVLIISNLAALPTSIYLICKKKKNKNNIFFI